jgi:hypothetical protein
MMLGFAPMTIKNLLIASAAVALLVSCGRQPTPAAPQTSSTATDRHALSQEELDAYINWSREDMTFEKAHMKKVPELVARMEAAQQRGDSGIAEETQRYQQESAATYREIMSRRPLTTRQQDAIERTMAAALRIRPDPGATTFVWEIHHNEQELDSLRRTFGAEMIDEIIAQEQRFLELKNE